MSSLENEVCESLPRAGSESHRRLMILPQIAGAISMDNPNGAGIPNGMEYRGVEYSVVQGVERGKWVWSLALDTNIKKSGQVGSKPAAVIVAERAIDRALDPIRLKIAKPAEYHLTVSMVRAILQIASWREVQRS